MHDSGNFWFHEWPLKLFRHLQFTDRQDGQDLAAHAQTPGAASRYTYRIWLSAAAEDDQENTLAIRS